MYCVSSPLTLRELLKLNATVILVIIFFTLYIASCEARHLRVNGKYSIKEPSLQIPSKDVIEVGATEKQMIRASLLMVHNRVLDQETQDGDKIDQSMGKEVLVASSGGDSSSRHSRRRFKRNEERSGARERSVLGVESSRVQLGPKATTATAAENLVVMDYPVARPAPAIHNR